MRLLIALAGGLTIYMVVALLTGTAPRFVRTARPARSSRLQQWLVHVGSDLSPRQFIAGSAAVGLTAWLLLAFAMGQWWSSFFPAVAVSGALAWTYERRRQERLRTIQGAWPDAIRHLLAYVRSGATVPAAMSSFAVDGPQALREVFAGWDERARLLGFAPALESIREKLADPTSDRVIEVLLIAYEWGGDLVDIVLADLAQEIVEDLRTTRAIRAEGTTQRIEAWMLGSLPWLLLVFLVMREGEYRAYYQSPSGRFVVLLVAVWWAIGMLWLRYLRRSESEERVFGASSAVPS